MPATAISPADFEVMQSLARALRAHVDPLPDGTEIIRAVRAGVEAAPHLPEPAQRQGKLIAVILELLRNPELTTDQSIALRESFFDVG